MNKLVTKEELDTLHNYFRGVLSNNEYDRKNKEHFDEIQAKEDFKMFEITFKLLREKEAAHVEEFNRLYEWAQDAMFYMKNLICTLGHIRAFQQIRDEIERHRTMDLKEQMRYLNRKYKEDN